MIELYHGGPTGHSASVLIALAEKGLGYEDRHLDLATFEQHRRAFLAVNPAGQVPVLRQDGRTLTEAFFILLYLDDRYPQPRLGGANPRERYAVQKWGKYVETHIAPNLAIVAWAAHGGTPGPSARAGFEALPPERRALWERAAQGFSDEEVAAARAALVKAVARIEEDLGAGPWLAGNEYGIADIAVFPHVARLAELDIELPDAVSDWLARLVARPQVRDVLGRNPAGANVTTMGPERGRWG